MRFTNAKQFHNPNQEYKILIPHSRYGTGHQAVAPAATLICSNESQKVRDQGAILSQQGRNPLYRAAIQHLFNNYEGRNYANL